MASTEKIFTDKESKRLQQIITKLHQQCPDLNDEKICTEAVLILEKESEFARSLDNPKSQVETTDDGPNGGGWL